MSYGSSSVDACQLVGVHTGPDPQGREVCRLPVQQAAKVDNLKRAKLGVLISP
jgi:hypothetical protein